MNTAEQQPEPDFKQPENPISAESLNVGAEHPRPANDNIHELPELIPDDLRYFGADDETVEQRMKIMAEHTEAGLKICDEHPGMVPYVNGVRCKPYFLANDNEALMGGKTLHVEWQEAA